MTKKQYLTIVLRLLPPPLPLLHHNLANTPHHRLSPPHHHRKHLIFSFVPLTASSSANLLFGQTSFASQHQLIEESSLWRKCWWLQFKWSPDHIKKVKVKVWISMKLYSLSGSVPNFIDSLPFFSIIFSLPNFI